MCVGAPAPYITPPQALLIAEALSAAPTHTAEASCGVEPTIQVSLFRPVSPNWWVPLFAADSRPPANAPFDQPAIGFLAWQAVSASCRARRRSPSALGLSYRTSPAFVSTRCTKYGSCHTPRLVHVGIATAISNGRERYWASRMPS